MAKLREGQFNDLLAVKAPATIAGLTKGYVPVKTHSNFVYVKDKDLGKSSKGESSIDETKKPLTKKSNNVVVKKNPMIPE